jgi:hypothetical protein
MRMTASRGAPDTALSLFGQVESTSVEAVNTLVTYLGAPGGSGLVLTKLTLTE